MAIRLPALAAAVLIAGAIGLTAAPMASASDVPRQKIEAEIAKELPNAPSLSCSNNMAGAITLKANVRLRALNAGSSPRMNQNTTMCSNMTGLVTGDIMIDADLLNAG
ncbi:hypothetical protein [Streptomyces sp. UNOC14_S4]|uniref:hypothetical protein n=1 Tax=Streptomyces sp. UNOC14_S4 TaxID=2872340 RepID=UPI001E4822E3|nr:hypothetical protein [Streptomyces sp. UNOC14_S4]MCC3768838.1 hypothetical protein [Streptomyces sp. UNOC14_S4]